MPFRQHPDQRPIAQRAVDVPVGMRGNAQPRHRGEAHAGPVVDDDPAVVVATGKLGPLAGSRYQRARTQTAERHQLMAIEVCGNLGCTMACKIVGRSA